MPLDLDFIDESPDIDVEIKEEIQIDYDIKSQSDYAQSDKTKLDYIKNKPLPYKSIKKLKNYSYQMYCDYLDYDYAKKYFEETNDDIAIGGCSSIRKDNLYGRNYDWQYNKNCDFKIDTPNRLGRYATSCTGGFSMDLDEEFIDSKEYSDIYKILPFRIVDGINEKGVFVNSNVVPNNQYREDITQTTPFIEELDRICNIMLPRYILDNFDNAEDAVEYIRNYISVFNYKTLEDKGYDLHLMVGDKDNNKTFVIEFIYDENNNVVRTEIIDVSERPIMTNFHLYGVTFNDDGSICTPYTKSLNDEDDAHTKNNIELYGSGLERFNILNNKYDNIETEIDMINAMNAVKYTNAYIETTENKIWYTELVGTNGEIDITVSSSLDLYNPAYAIMQELYNNRDRETALTWQTVHSCVYSLDYLSCKICFQEDEEWLEFSLQNSGGLVEETDPIFTNSPAYNITNEDIDKWNEDLENRTYTTEYFSDIKYFEEEHHLTEMVELDLGESSIAPICAVIPDGATPGSLPFQSLAYQASPNRAYILQPSNLSEYPSYQLYWIFEEDRERLGLDKGWYYEGNDEFIKTNITPIFITDFNGKYNCHMMCPDIDLFKAVLGLPEYATKEITLKEKLNDVGNLSYKISNIQEGTIFYTKETYSNEEITYIVDNCQDLDYIYGDNYKGIYINDDEDIPYIVWELSDDGENYLYIYYNTTLNCWCVTDTEEKYEGELPSIEFKKNYLNSELSEDFDFTILFKDNTLRDRLEAPLKKWNYQNEINKDIYNVIPKEGTTMYINFNFDKSIFDLDENFIIYGGFYENISTYLNIYNGELTFTRYEEPGYASSEVTHLKYSISTDSWVYSYYDGSSWVELEVFNGEDEELDNYITQEWSNFELVLNNIQNEDLFKEIFYYKEYTPGKTLEEKFDEVEIYQEAQDNRSIKPIEELALITDPGIESVYGDTSWELYWYDGKLNLYNGVENYDFYVDAEDVQWIYGNGQPLSDEDLEIIYSLKPEDFGDLSEASEEELAFFNSIWTGEPLSKVTIKEKVQEIDEKIKKGFLHKVRLYNVDNNTTVSRSWGTETENNVVRWDGTIDIFLTDKAIQDCGYEMSADDQIDIYNLWKYLYVYFSCFCTSPEYRGIPVNLCFTEYEEIDEQLKPIRNNLTYSALLQYNDLQNQFYLLFNFQNENDEYNSFSNQLVIINDTSIEGNVEELSCIPVTYKENISRT